MKIAFCATVGDVAPILIFLQFPQPGEPVQNTDLKLSGMDTIVTFDERIAEVVDGEVLQLRQCSVIEIKVIRIPCNAKELQYYGFNRASYKG